MKYECFLITYVFSFEFCCENLHIFRGVSCHGDCVSRFPLSSLFLSFLGFLDLHFASSLLPLPLYSCKNLRFRGSLKTDNLRARFVSSLSFSSSFVFDGFEFMSSWSLDFLALLSFVLQNKVIILCFLLSYCECNAKKTLSS